MVADSQLFWAAGDQHRLPLGTHWLDASLLHLHARRRSQAPQHPRRLRNRGRVALPGPPHGPLLLERKRHRPPPSLARLRLGRKSRFAHAWRRHRMVAGRNRRRRRNRHASLRRPKSRARLHQNRRRRTPRPRAHPPSPPISPRLLWSFPNPSFSPPPTASASTASSSFRAMPAPISSIPPSFSSTAVRAGRCSSAGTTWITTTTPTR